MITDLPVATSADVLAVLPAFVRASDTAVVRDAIIAMLTAIFQEMQVRSEYAAWQSDILYASGIYLDGLGKDRGFTRIQGELDPQYRVRILQVPQLVTPTAILLAVNNIISPYTTYTSKYFESIVDRWFVTDGTLPWHSFIGANPSYLDRLYEDDVTANGTYIPGREAAGAWAFSDTKGRYFVIRAPSLTGSDDQHAFILTGAGSFIADGSNTAGTEADGTVATFMFGDRETSLNIYSAIVSMVNRIKGASIRWMLYVDPTIAS